MKIIFPSKMIIILIIYISIVSAEYRTGRYKDIPKNVPLLAFNCDTDAAYVTAKTYKESLVAGLPAI